MDYQAGQLYRGNDKYKDHGNCVVPFLDEMALLYPTRQFAGLNLSVSGTSMVDYIRDTLKYAMMVRTINKIKPKVQFGGVVMMFGLLENYNCTDAGNIDKGFKAFLDTIRDIIGNKTLPCVFGRFEQYSEIRNDKLCHACDSVVIAKINNFPQVDKYTCLSPLRPIPAMYYCDNHHYNKAGYALWGKQAAYELQKNNLDFWNK